ncbi:uncharacterized protein LOC121384743 [Gigantopelta aegis]|uniref:uncharacterized protein LOC121384743 n=1 Tax=Gigantopelta aegis TaxID=1735272 RepID=UPI001B887DFD|nr:uncharacterized protein LOC121384743 [Gigantopelta aegis]
MQMITSPSCMLLQGLFNCVSNSLCSSGVYCATAGFFSLFKENKVQIEWLLKLNVDSCDDLVFVNPCSDVNTYICLEAGCPTTETDVNCKFYKDKIDCAVQKLSKYNCTNQNMVDLISVSPYASANFNITSCG